MQQLRITFSVYLAMCLGCIVASVLPALALNRFISEKMKNMHSPKGEAERLGFVDHELSVATGTRVGSTAGVMSAHASISPPAPAYKVQLKNTDPRSVAQINRDLLKLNRDRPFGNTITLDTPILPPQFQEIFDAKTQSTEERIIKLRRRLKEENQHLAAYLVLLLLLSSYTMFVSFGGKYCDCV